MDRRGYQQYKQQSVNSMTPGELLLLLYDEAVDRCVDIVTYLDETLDHKYPISGELSRLYEYFTYQLGRIKIGRNKKELESLRPMLADLRDAFHSAEKDAGSQGKSDLV